jgi:hypothetical protein
LYVVDFKSKKLSTSLLKRTPGYVTRELKRLSETKVKKQKKADKIAKACGLKHVDVFEFLK